jgi:DNA-binding transcriptional ArsR family regulator
MPRYAEPVKSSSPPRALSSSGHPEAPSDAQVKAAVTSFALLSDATRVRMLWAMRSGPTDVAGLAAVAGCGASTASQHLAKLRLAGLVDGVRDGRRVLYALRGAHVDALLAEALFHADHQVTGSPTHD